MFRRPNTLALALLLFVSAGLLPNSSRAQDKQDKNAKVPTAEQVAETVIIVYGGRAALQQIRRNGVERGRVTRVKEDGSTEEVTYERRFMRGETSDKDKIRLDQKTPSLEYSLIYDGARVFGIVNGTTFTPRQEAVASFVTQRQHDIDALLRYKENGSTVSYVGKEKQKNIDMWVLDLEDKEKRRTRYYISATTGRILWLEYEEKDAGGSVAKYKRSFHDYRRPQGTMLPYRSVLFEDGKQVEEATVLNVSYGAKMDDSAFKNAEATTETSATP